MAKMSFGNRAGRIRVTSAPAGGPPAQSADEAIRELKKAMEKPPGEDYRDKSLAIHGMVCGRCGREFDHTNRHLLTVHHRDGNHHNNPPDGSNWENLCVDCHDDVHSRTQLAEYMGGSTGDREQRIVYQDREPEGETGGLGALLKSAMNKKK